METVVGIFQSRTVANDALQQLRLAGVPEKKITVLWPETSDEQIATLVPVSDAESPGPGEAMAGAVGGALGAAGGATLGAAIASLFLPGVGPILVAGAIGATLLGAGGALTGVAAGEALEHLANELPHDELFVYEDALRHGHTVIIVYADDSTSAGRVRYLFQESGVESIDAARDNWWLGLRDDEQAEYERSGGNFKQDEGSYRRGFEAALHRQMRGRSYEEAASDLKRCHQGTCAERPFRAGYDRGQKHQRSWETEQASAARGRR
jgi:hypothetical protein